MGMVCCSGLIGLHAMTACDSTSTIYGHGKKKGLDAMLKSTEHQQALLQLGENTSSSDQILQLFEKFVCFMYTSDKHAGTTTYAVHHWCFCEKNKTNETLPPTTHSLSFDIQRANYKTLVWNRSFHNYQQLPSPTDCGWKQQEGNLQPVLMTRDPAPTAHIKLLSCKCTKSKCKRIDVCQCVSNGMPCMDACVCMGEEECQNTYKTQEYRRSRL